MGVAIASYGEINFNITGVMFQMASIVSESTRLVMVQLLLQSRGLKLNPVTTLYYVAPCCFAFLLLPFFFLEGPKIMADPNLSINPLIFLANALVAFGEPVAGAGAGSFQVTGLLPSSNACPTSSGLATLPRQASTWPSSCSSARPLPSP